MELELKLKHRCIETEIKREYNNSVSQYFKNTNHSLLEKRIELLKKALETLDFRYLRANYSELCAGTEAFVKLSEREGKLEITIDGLPVLLREKT